MINSPVELIYGSEDWARDNERKKTQKLLGLKNFKIIKNCGHFSFLENPKIVSEIISK